MSAGSRALLEPRPMAPVRVAMEVLDMAALELIERLIAGTRRASEPTPSGELASLHELLDARDSMLASLGTITEAFAASDLLSLSRHEIPVASSTRLELLARVNEFQRANTRLLRAVGQDAARLKASMLRLEHGDSVGLAYHAEPPGVSNLNLMR